MVQKESEYLPLPLPQPLPLMMMTFKYNVDSLIHRQSIIVTLKDPLKVHQSKSYFLHLTVQRKKRLKHTLSSHILLTLLRER